MVQQSQWMFAFMVAVVYLLLCMFLSLDAVKPVVQSNLPVANPNNEYHYFYQMAKVALSVMLTVSLLTKQVNPNSQLSF